MLTLLVVQCISPFLVLKYLSGQSNKQTIIQIFEIKFYRQVVRREKRASQLVLEISALACITQDIFVQQIIH